MTTCTLFIRDRRLRLSFARGARLTCLLLIVPVLLSAGVATAGAAASPATKAVGYRGLRLVVPRGWPVLRLGSDSRTCVRFDRHAVYLGTPSTAQLCPAHAAGRTEAILAQPLSARAAAATSTATLPAASAGGGSSAQVVDRARGVILTATWAHAPAIVRRALGVASLTAAARRSARARRPAAGTRTGALSPALMQRALRSSNDTAPSATAAAPGGTYTGQGFDACSTPSASQMSAWGASPYRAIGVYIGGTNMACSQPNLTATWVSQQSAAGWHLIPIYVGLQAPSNSCGCASISAATAAGQGAAAADDAVADAQAVGMGPGNPLYLDMEAYSRTSANTSAVMAFIQAWTQELHNDGYRSGVYSSDGSGIADLVAREGTGYLEPDEIWMANWNNAANTQDSAVPAQYWADHQRLHQYRGAHNESYGGVTINIDGDYVDAATAAAGSSGLTTAAGPATAPSLRVKPGADGTVSLTPSWTGATGVSSWMVTAGQDPTALSWTAPVQKRVPIVTDNSFAYFAVQALNSAGQEIGGSLPVATPPHLAIFGQSVFVPRHGLAGVPTGCLGTAPCTLTTTITSGRTTLAKTGPEHLGIGGGIVYFSLKAAGEKLVSHAKRPGLAVTVSVRDSSGLTVSRKVNLVSFSTSGAAPRRSLSQSSALKLIGASDFVSNGWVGGLLAGCFDSAPCRASTKIVAQGKVIAQSKTGGLGVDELGYLHFTLTAAGHRMLAKAKGNQLGATVTVTAQGTSSVSGGASTGGAAPGGTAPTAGGTATGHIVLSSY